MTAPEHDGVASTPGVLGYLVAVWVSWLLISLGVGLCSAVFDGQVFAAKWTWDELLEVPGDLLEWSIIVGVFAFPTAPIGVLLVHVACERFDPQWIHVLAAGVAGAAAVLIALGLLLGTPFDFWRLALGVGIGTAVGRAAVIPWVPVVRQRYPSGTPPWKRWALG